MHSSFEKEEEWISREHILALWNDMWKAVAKTLLYKY